MIIFLLFLSAFTAFGQTPETGEDEDIELPIAILEVKLKSSEFTEYYPECGEDCIPWSFWNRYKARVVNVIDGEFADKSIDFVYLQHAGFAKVKNRKAFVIIYEFSDPETVQTLGTPYFAKQFAFQHNVVCFNTGLMDHIGEYSDRSVWNNDYIVREPDNVQCYDPWDLRAKPEDD